MKSRKMSCSFAFDCVSFRSVVFRCKAWVTGSVRAVDGNNIGPFVKDVVFCFRTFIFSFLCLIPCLSQDMLQELVSVVLCGLLVVAIPPTPGQYVSATVTYFAKNLKNPSYKWRRQ